MRLAGLVVVMIVLACAQPALANPGDLDPLFSKDGMATVAFGFDQGYATGVQSDGKIVVGGTTGNPNGRFALTRLNSDGTLDTSFGTNGTVVTDFPGSLDQITSIAIQPDDEIVAAGFTANPGSDFAVARYTANGALDNSFDSDGMLTIDFGATDQAKAVAIQSDGDIVLGGFRLGADNDFAVARYDPGAGALDTSFSGDGKATTDFGIGSNENIRGVAIQPDGKIVAVGTTTVNGSLDFGIARYTSSGTLDTSFSGDGIQVTNFDGFVDAANAVGIQSDGKIVAGGQGGNGFAIARYSTDGTLDASHSDQISPAGSDVAHSLAILPDGKILMAGGDDAGGPNLDSGDFQVARYTSSLTLDTSFSGDGKQAIDLGGFNDSSSSGESAEALAIQSDGKPVIAGYSNATGAADFATVRLTTAGALDSSFGSGGQVLTDFGGSTDVARSVAVLSSGKLVAGGTSGQDFAFARFNSAGLVESAKTVNVGGNDVLNGLFVQTNGKLVAVGSKDSDFALIRVDPTSFAVDTSFAGGARTTDFGGTDSAAAVASQFGDELVAAGTSSGDFALARYAIVDGALDTTFGTSGTVTTDFGGTDSAHALAVDGNDRIVVAGESAGDFALARYSSAGALDNTFGTGGLVTLDLGGVDSANAVAIDSDGKIVVAGVSDGDFELARFDSSGAPDTNFGTDGAVRTDFGGVDEARSLVIQPDGKLLVGGVGGGDFALARYASNGSPDTTFSGDGRLTTNFGGSDAANAIALQADGKLVAVGSTDAGSSTDVAAARYEAIDTTPPDTQISSGPADGSSTSNASANFQYAAVPSNDVDHFECKLDDEVSFTTCPNAGKPYSNLSDGSHTFAVRAVDAAGNFDPTPATRTWTVDTLPPLAPQINSGPFEGSTVGSSSATFTYSDGSGDVDHYECLLDDALAFSGCPNGAVTYPTLADGPHTFKVRAVDAVGNVGSATTRNWMIDTVPPNTSIATKPGPESSSSNASFTYAASPSNDVDHFECRLDGQLTFATCANSGQSYQGLADGSHTFTVRAVDAAGNIDPSPDSWSWNVDTTAPDTNIVTGPVNGAAIASNAASFTYAGSPPNDTDHFECRLDTEPFFTTCPNGGKAYTSLAEGSHTFSVRAVDALGNGDATAATVTWTVDTTAPDTSLTGGPADGSSTTDTGAAFTYSGAPGADTDHFECKLDGAGFAGCPASGSSFTGLAVGSHTFSVRAVDSLGNVDATPATRTWTVAEPPAQTTPSPTTPTTTDTTPPAETTPAGTTPTPAPAPAANRAPNTLLGKLKLNARKRTAAFTFRGVDPESGRRGLKFECRLDKGKFKACRSPFTRKRLRKGKHTFQVRAVDAAGLRDATPATRRFRLK